MSTTSAVEGLALGVAFSQDPVSGLSSDSIKGFEPARDNQVSITLPAKPNLVVPSLRSMTGMQGLLLAELGDSMVELDMSGTISGFREGSRIALGSMTPGGGSKRGPTTSNSLHDQRSLGRHGTLLTVGGAPERNAAELKSLLGNSSSRLKSGAAVLPPSGKGTVGVEPVALEQAKARARVEVDIVLESNVCVQGGYLKGYVKIHVRERSKKESPILVAEGKVRIVGFECIPNGDSRYTFYHCAAPLSSIATSPIRLYASASDAEGFSEAKEGVHVIPFAMHLPLECESNAKGVLHSQSVVRVRYIAMASIKVKHSDSDHRSIAHFYRNCQVWPRLDPSVILAPAPRPLKASTSKTVFMGGNGKVKLTAMLHRLHWVAGQQCNINLTVKNDTKKTVKSVTFTLIRTTIVFRPHPHLDALPSSHEHASDPDACQTSTTQKEVAETTLEIGQQGTKGHASARGWWIGVGSGEELTFSHFLLLPPDALSITRGRLLEVEYTIRVSLSVGSFGSDVQVILPVRIINFLSIDPPPSSPLSPTEEFGVHNTLRLNNSRTAEAYVSTEGCHRSRPEIEGLFRPYHDDFQQNSDPPFEFEETSLRSCQYDDDFLSMSGGSTDSAEEEDSQLDDEIDQSILLDRYLDSTEALLGNLSLHDDSDEAVQFAIASAKTNDVSPARFADLYHASFQECLARDVSAHSSGALVSEGFGHESGLSSESTPRVRHIDVTVTAAANNQVEQDVGAAGAVGRPTQTTRGSSSFDLRVQEKLHTFAPNRHTFPVVQDETQSPAATSTPGHMDAPTTDDYCSRDCEGENSVTAPSCTHLAKSSISGSDLQPSVSGVLTWLTTNGGNGGQNQVTQESTTLSPLPIMDKEAPTTAASFPRTGSRLLPSPPIIVPVVDGTSNPSSTAPLSETRPQTAVNVEPGPTLLRMSVERLPLQCTPGGSVKARIKELEEKAKLNLGEM